MSGDHELFFSCGSAVCSRCLNGGQCLKSGCLCLDGYSGDRCQWGKFYFFFLCQRVDTIKRDR